MLAGAGLRPGGAGRQLGRRFAVGVLPGAGRAAHHRDHGRRRPGQPRDLSLDPNDRQPGSVWGNGPGNLARTGVPVLLCTYTADQSTFPSTRAAWGGAGGARLRNADIVGGNPYLAGQPQLVTQVADGMADWMLRL